MTHRERIYEKLGLEVGSLSSESGNDWQRAAKEVEEEDKQFSEYKDDGSYTLYVKNRHQKYADEINNEYRNKQ